MIVAAASIGLFPDIKGAAAKLAKLDMLNKYVPDERAKHVYEKLADVNNDLYRALQTFNIYDKLHDIIELMGE